MDQPFRDFLSFTPSQKEVALAIAKDTDELSDFVSQLEDAGFRQAVDALELSHKITHVSKTFLIVKNMLSKDVYDFIVQYPTGQVEIYDKYRLKSDVASPIYTDVAVIIVITREALQKAEHEGFFLLPQVGMTYQS